MHQLTAKQKLGAGFKRDLYFEIFHLSHISSAPRPGSHGFWLTRQLP